MCGFGVPVFPALALVAPVIHAESAPPPDVMVWRDNYGAGLVWRPPVLTREQAAIVYRVALTQNPFAAA